MVKLEDILVHTDDEWLSSGKDPLPICIPETLQSHWLNKCYNIYIRTKRGDICVYF